MNVVPLDLWFECEFLEIKEINHREDHGHLYRCSKRHTMKTCPHSNYLCPCADILNLGLEAIL